MQRLNTSLRPEAISPADNVAADTSEEVAADLCVIGAGAGGLPLAAAAARFGLKVILVEKQRMGATSLYSGCVASKALMAAANRAHQMRTAQSFGIAATEPQIDLRAVREHVDSVVASLAQNSSAERFAGLGVQVIHAAARFADRRSVIAGDKRIRAKHFCIATGSSPFVPAIPGLDKIPFFTDETISRNEESIGHLIVVGGTATGLELAQAYLRLGARVTVLETLNVLNDHDPELSDVVLRSLRDEGLSIREGVKVERIDGPAGAVRITVATTKGAEVIEGTHILIAAGRKPEVDGLNLDAARIKYDKRGIQVSNAFVTSNARIFAIGDVTGGPPFAHAGEFQAGVVLRRLLSRFSGKSREDLVPRVTFTDPELVTIGLTEEQAKERHGTINIYRWPFHENDRARIERCTDGFVKAVTDRHGRIVGAAIVGRRASELIQTWALAISQGLRITAMTEWISPYPTMAEVNKRTALSYYALEAGSPLVRKVVTFFRKSG